MTIVGESARPAPGAALVWRPLDPPAELDVQLLVRALEPLTGDEPLPRRGAAVARGLGWLSRPALN